MNIVDEKAEHILFGQGLVISQSANMMTVRFSREFGTKQFIYPDAFDRYLKLCDPGAENAVLEELRKKQAEVETQRMEKLRQYEEIKARKKSELASQKSKNVKKSRVQK